MQFGNVTLARVKGPAELRSLLPDYIQDPETLVVKPNWFSCHTGNFTDAETLRFLLEALDARVVAVEGYTLERQDGSMTFNVDGEEVDWRWILRNPGWEWVKEGGRWDEIRRQDA